MLSLPTTTTKETPRTLTLDEAAGTKFLTIKKRLSGKREQLDKYTLAEIGSDDEGERGFELQRITPDRENEVYHVLMNGARRAECDCRGFAAHGHCKHSDALLKLLGIGQLPAAA